MDDSRSGRCVLVTDWIEGTLKISERERMVEIGLDPREVGFALVRAFAKMTFIDGFVHNDPHPGNILVRGVVADGAHDEGDGNGSGVGVKLRPQIVLLDAGACLSLDDSLRRSFCEFWSAAMTNNTATMSKACEAMGLSPRQGRKIRKNFQADGAGG